MSGDRHSKQRGQRWEALLQAREVCIRQLLVTRVMGARTGKPVSLLPPALVKKNNPSLCLQDCRGGEWLLGRVSWYRTGSSGWGGGRRAALCLPVVYRTGPTFSLRDPDPRPRLSAPMMDWEFLPGQNIM